METQTTHLVEYREKTASAHSVSEKFSKQRRPISAHGPAHPELCFAVVVLI